MVRDSNRVTAPAAYTEYYSVSCPGFECIVRAKPIVDFDVSFEGWNVLTKELISFVGWMWTITPIIGKREAA